MNFLPRGEPIRGRVELEWDQVKSIKQAQRQEAGFSESHRPQSGLVSQRQSLPGEMLGAEIDPILLEALKFLMIRRYTIYARLYFLGEVVHARDLHQLPIPVAQHINIYSRAIVEVLQPHRRTSANE